MARPAEKVESRRPPLTREAIVEAAIEIADRDGLEAVSIRRIAAAIEARPMSLYDHIGNKDGLLALMADHVVEETLIPEPVPDDWREAIRAIARRHFELFTAHPWSVRLFTTHATFGANATRSAEQMRRITARLPLDEEQAWAMSGAVNDYVFGYSLRAVSAAASVELADAIPREAVERFPDLAALKASLRSRTSVERLEFGLEVMLDGIARRIAEGDGAR